MLAFEFMSWAAFGAIIAGFTIWFMKRRDHTRDLILIGAVGGILGGLFGRLFSGAPVFISSYNMVSLICAIAAASVAIYFFWYVRFRHRPGET